jgi:serine/threonine-protein kinase
MSTGISFGPYALLRRIARGGMAEVFLANHRVADGVERRVALKRILPHLAEDPEFLQMFEAEARLASQLAHPNIVHVYDFGAIDGYCFISMEHVLGVDCATLIRAGKRTPMPVAYAVRIAADICAGLDYAHRRTDNEGRPLGVVHRDVSPQNILVSFDGVVKLVDFGIAKAAHQLERTRPGIIKGKFSYMSPEQVEGRRLDARSDLFNVGIVLHELLSGVPLFDRDNAGRAMSQIRSGGWPPIASLRRDIPPELSALLATAMAVARERRPSSAGQLQVELEHVLKGCQETVTPAILGRYLRQRFPELLRAGEVTSPPRPSPVGGEGIEVSVGTPLIDLQQLERSFGAAAPGPVAPPPSDSDPMDWHRSSPLDGIVSSSNYLRQLLQRAAAPAAAGADPTVPLMASPADELKPPSPRRLSRWWRRASREQPGVRLGLLALVLLCASLPASDRRAPPPAPPLPPAQAPQGPAAPTPNTGPSRPLAPVVSALPSRRPLVGPPSGRASPPLAARTEPLAAPAEALLPREAAPPARESAPRPQQVARAPSPPPFAQTGAVKVQSEGNEGGPGLTFDPSRSPAELQLITRPVGAQIVLNGVKMASDVLRQGAAVPAGRVELVVTASGYHDIRRTISLEPGELRRLQLRLEPIDQPDDSSGMLEVASLPSAEVFWAGRKLGDTPIAPVRLPPGRHWIVLKAPTKPVRKIEVTIRAGQTTQLNEQL